MFLAEFDSRIYPAPVRQGLTILHTIKLVFYGFGGKPWQTKIPVKPMHSPSTVSLQLVLASPVGPTTTHSYFPLSSSRTREMVREATLPSNRARNSRPGLISSPSLNQLTEQSVASGNGNKIIWLFSRSNSCFYFFKPVRFWSKTKSIFTSKRISPPEIKHRTFTSRKLLYQIKEFHSGKA